jgi:hypothetical protein
MACLSKDRAAASAAAISILVRVDALAVCGVAAAVAVAVASRCADNRACGVVAGAALLLLLGVAARLYATLLGSSIGSSKDRCLQDHRLRVCPRLKCTSVAVPVAPAACRQGRGS